MSFFFFQVSEQWKKLPDKQPQPQHHQKHWWGKTCDRVRVAYIFHLLYPPTELLQQNHLLFDTHATQFINLTTGLIRLQALSLSCTLLRVSDSSSSWLCKYLGCTHVNSYLQGLVQRQQLFCRALVNNQSSTNSTKICTGTVPLSVHFFGSVCVSLSLM